MSASPVGSEMCIRDSPDRERFAVPDRAIRSAAAAHAVRALAAAGEAAVSYTHLTLPTICSV
eukprot:7197228-Alexandrium_andersonii.AAC.1